MLEALEIALWRSGRQHKTKKARHRRTERSERVREERVKDQSGGATEQNVTKDRSKRAERHQEATGEAQEASRHH